MSNNTFVVNNNSETTNGNSVYIILEDIRSAFNVGSFFRTADAAGITKLLLCGITPCPPHRKVLKTALGATETVPWEHYRDAAAAIKSLPAQTQVIAVEITAESKPYHHFDYRAPVCLIFGNEISGVSETALNAATAVVSIPMLGSKESLNVSVSFGIMVYHLQQILGNLE